jgi:hypothetical protein
LLLGIFDGFVEGFMDGASEGAFVGSLDGTWETKLGDWMESLMEWN